MAKNIVICCDGTGNRGDALENGRPATTNVHKLYAAALDYAESEWTQVTWYDAGVGTGTSSQSAAAEGARRIAATIGARTPEAIAKAYGQFRMMLELATGAGILENIVQGYTQIVHHYRPGDRIYLFGFSRGAYTARCLAGVISRCGLLRAENIRYARDVVHAYRFRDERDDVAAESRVPAVDHDSPLFHPAGSVRVRMLGVWDTVASLGLPLWGWWFRLGNLWSNRAIDTEPAAVCEQICHAASMDERRSQFFVALFDERRRGFLQARAARRVAFDDQPIEQVWFRGSHAGVGGGYADTALSDIALAWMLERAKAAGVKFRPGALAGVRTDYLGQVHNQLQRQKAWYLFGTWPRWHPCPRPPAAGETPTAEGFGALHESVYARAAIARRRREEQEEAERADAVRTLRGPGRRLPLDAEEMHFLDPGQSARILVRADRQWNRTGLVVEAGAAYRITAAAGDGGAGTWRDKECKPCGPEGEAVVGGLRRYTGWLRRLESARWMELVATVAHPRFWPLRERGARDLLRYLIWRDPEELTGTLVPLGRCLGQGGSGAVLRNRAPAGMLYAFANDAWLAYANNSGAIALDVERIDASAIAEDAPNLFTVEADGAARGAAVRKSAG